MTLQNSMVHPETERSSTNIDQVDKEERMTYR